MVRRWIHSADVEIDQATGALRVDAGLTSGVATASEPGKAVNVLTTSTVLLAAKANRVSAVFVNNSDVDISLSLGGTPVVGSGIILKASGGCYEINRTNLYVGAVSAIRAAATGNKPVGVTEF